MTDTRKFSFKPVNFDVYATSDAYNIMDNAIGNSIYNENIMAALAVIACGIHLKDDHFTCMATRLGATKLEDMLHSLEQFNLAYMIKRKSVIVKIIEGCAWRQDNTIDALKVFVKFGLAPLAPPDDVVPLYNFVRCCTSAAYASDKHSAMLYLLNMGFKAEHNDDGDGETISYAMASKLIIYKFWKAIDFLIRSGQVDADEFVGHAFHWSKTAVMEMFPAYLLKTLAPALIARELKLKG